MFNTSTNATPHPNLELQILKPERLLGCCSHETPQLSIGASYEKQRITMHNEKQRVQQLGDCNHPRVSPIITERRQGRELNRKLSRKQKKHIRVQDGKKL